MAIGPTDPTNFVEVDRIHKLGAPSLTDYIKAVSDYIATRDVRTDGEKKAAQIRMSAALGRFLLNELRQRIGHLAGEAGERDVSGALRVVRADVTEMHDLDGLRLAIEIKPVNAAVGRAIWNRFGDIRTFAVNLHLKFPFAVIGGVLTLPSYEWATSKAKGRYKKPTTDVVLRAVKRLERAGGREKEGDAPHLMEGVWVLLYDPDTLKVDPNVPPPGTGLRLDEFIDNLVDAYEGRFE